MSPLFLFFVLCILRYFLSKTKKLFQKSWFHEAYMRYSQSFITVHSIATKEHTLIQLQYSRKHNSLSEEKKMKSNG